MDAFLTLDCLFCVAKHKRLFKPKMVYPFHLILTQPAEKKAETSSFHKIWYSLYLDCFYAHLTAHQPADQARVTSLLEMVVF